MPGGRACSRRYSLHKLYINRAQSAVSQVGPDWSWPVDPSKYDRSSDLRPDEASALSYLVSRQRRCGHFPSWIQKSLLRLTIVIDAVMTAIDAPKQPRGGVLTVLILEMHQRQTAFWGWTQAEWLEILCASKETYERNHPTVIGDSRHFLVAGMYLLRAFDEFKKLGIIDRTALSCRIFGRWRVEGAIKRVVELIRSWGYGRSKTQEVQWAVCTALLANKSPHLEDLTVSLLEAERSATTVDSHRASIGVLSRALAGLGIIPQALPSRCHNPSAGNPRNGVAPEWVKWVDRWRATSTLQPSSRNRHHTYLLKAARWVTGTHPDCASPDQWTRELAAEWVAVVCRMNIGDWTQKDKKYLKHLGKPLSAKSRSHHLSSLSTFFRDIQEWEWIPRRFDPRRCFAVPRSLRALISPNPRVIADDLWAKLLWAGLNLTEADLTTSYKCATHYYPLAMFRALTVVWLFCGLRVDEIRRLRVGCTREQWNKSTELSAGICNLDVSVNKTSRAFTKPVDQIVGDAVRTWETQRPEQPAELDEKTSELVNFLFMFRGHRIAGKYINDTLVPILCKKAGMPTKDARGNITSHRARSTIASQLFNAKEPMSLFELQKWLGHKWANSTQYYLDISPTKLANSYRDAGYFARNVRAIEVLIDRDVVKNGTAAREPWMYYDLGHGYCTFDFFEQCKFRMVCAKCSFYRPKTSTEAQLLEGKSNLMRLRQGIPLTEQERAAVDDGVEAMEKLLKQLADVPTPAGPTPRQLHPSGLVQLNVTPTKLISNEGGDDGARMG
jgi:integrase